jgi:hypothetical protein
VQNYSQNCNNNDNENNEDDHNNNKHEFNYDILIVNHIEKNNFDLSEKKKQIKNGVEEILKKYTKIMDTFYDVINVIQK